MDWSIYLSLYYRATFQLQRRPYKFHIINLVSTLFDNETISFQTAVLLVRVDRVVAYIYATMFVQYFVWNWLPITRTLELPITPPPPPPPLTGSDLFALQIIFSIILPPTTRTPANSNLFSFSLMVRVIGSQLCHVCVTFSRTSRSPILFLPTQRFIELLPR